MQVSEIKKNTPLEVHVIPLGLEFERIKHIFQKYKPDKIYFLKSVGRVGNFIKEFYYPKIKSYMKNEQYTCEIAPLQEVKIDDIQNIIITLDTIFDNEIGNKIYLNISTSSKLLAVYFYIAAARRLFQNDLEPILYYVISDNYLIIEILELQQRFIDAFKEYRGEIEVKYPKLFEILQEMHNLFTRAEGEGTSFINKEDTLPKIHEVPLYKIKSPIDFESVKENGNVEEQKHVEIAKQLLQILEVLQSNSGVYPSISELIIDYDVKYGIKVNDNEEKEKVKSAKRFWMQYRIKKLEESNLIKLELSSENKKRVHLTKIGEAELRRNQDRLRTEYDREFQLNVLERKKGHNS